MTTTRLAGRLKLRQLQLLSALGAGASLRRAAADLNLSQPAATRLLAELEAALGYRLFERSRRGLTATPVGRAMVKHARVMLADLDGARAELAAIARGASGRITVGSLMFTGLVLVPRAIAKVKAAHPLLEISVREGTQDELLPALREGALDLLVGRLTTPETGEDVELEVLYEQDFRVACGSRHALRRRRPRSLRDLVAEPWVLPATHTPFRQRLDLRFVAEAGARPLDVVESNSLPLTLALLRDNRRLAVLPVEVASDYAGLGLLAELPLVLSGLLGPVTVFRRRAQPLSDEARALIEAIRAVGSDLGR